MSDFLDKTVLVTGGASGIGKMCARKSHREGAKRIILWDIDSRQLHKTVDEFKQEGIIVLDYITDLSDPDQIYATANRVLKEVGPVDILINNAGVVTGKPFAEHTPSDIQQTIDVNVLGVLHTTRAFLPSMIQNGSGHIVPIASAAGMVANINMAAYVSSKWAVSGWADSLRLELEQLEGNFHVTTIQPSYIDTGMFEGVQAPLLTPVLSVDRITDKIIQGIKKNRLHVREPFMVKLIPLLKGLLPTRAFDLVAGKLFKLYHSMDTFKGRSPNEH